MLVLYKITARSVKDSFYASIDVTLPTLFSPRSIHGATLPAPIFKPLPPFLCSVVKFLLLINSIFALNYYLDYSVVLLPATLLDSSWCKSMVMEAVEEANRAAVESCKKLVAALSRSGDPFQPVPVAAETDEAVARFGKVTAVLSNRLGHARARIGKSSVPPVDASCLLDHPSMAPCQTSSGGLLVSTLAPLPTMRSVSLVTSQEMTEAAPCASVTLTPASKFDRSMFLETPLLDLNSCGVPSPSAMAVQKSSSKVVAAPVPNPCTATSDIQFQPQQQKAQNSFLFDQTPSAEQFHIEVPRVGRGTKEVISFSIDNNSVCTSSAATSFFTSISSQLISMSDAATSSAATGKKACGKRGEDGGVKCHCPKKKLVLFASSLVRGIIELSCKEMLMLRLLVTSLQATEGQAGGEGAGDQRQERRYSGG
jgi:hypothetical protein